MSYSLSPLSTPPEHQRMATMAGPAQVESPFRQGALSILVFNVALIAMPFFFSPPFTEMYGCRFWAIVLAQAALLYRMKEAEEEAYLEEKIVKL